MIEKIFVLSTAHMPNSDPNFGDLRVLKGTYEHIIPCVARADMITEWWGPIMEQALADGCTYVCFEADADIDDRFVIYEW